jgi:DNA invertase Pin-like site-specific DNA recombinase
MKLGYARVSSDDQILDLQRKRLSVVGCEKLFEEIISGVTRTRPQLEKLIDQIRADDILVVTRLDRLARSTTELLRIVERLSEKKAGLQSLDEPWADTTSPSGRMVLTVFGGIAEFERALIRQRTHDGRLDARKRGVAFGRPSKLRPDQKKLFHQLLKQGLSISSIARSFNVHPATIIDASEKTNPYDSTLSLSALRPLLK